jgi:hypothetical protein
MIGNKASDAIAQVLSIAGTSASDVLKGVLSFATISALVSWLFIRQHRIVSVRASYLAQLESLHRTVTREMEYCTKEHAYSWFPVLPFFQADVGPLSLAGILTNREVRAITAAYITYRETLTYLWQYGEASRESSVIDPAIGINLKDATIKAYYTNDLKELERAADASVRTLRTAQRMRFAVIATIALTIAVASSYYLLTR